MNWKRIQKEFSFVMSIGLASGGAMWGIQGNPLNAAIGLMFAILAIRQSGIFEERPNNGS